MMALTMGSRCTKSIAHAKPESEHKPQRAQIAITTDKSDSLVPVTRLDVERQYRHLVQSITDYAIYLLSLDGIVSSWNGGAERLKGYTTEEIVGQHFSCFYLAEDRDAGRPAEALRIAREVGRYEAQGWRVRQDGSRFLANVVIDLVRNDTGVEIGFAKITKDVTEQVAAQRAVLASERRFRHLVQSVTDYAVYMLDLDGVVINWNIGAQRAKGYRAEEIVGKHFSYFYTPQDRELKLPERALMTARQTGRFEGEGWRLRKDGTVFWAFVIIDIVKDDDGNEIGFAKITRDMTREKLHADKIKDLLTLDQLTGLLNRTTFRERLANILSDRNCRGRVAVVLIDLDHFKAVNDKFGHLAGDLVLKKIGQRITVALRSGDLAGRLGGDEFALVLKINEADDIVALVERFSKAICQPIPLSDDKKIDVSVSLGVKPVTSDSSNIDIALRKADIALYEAKSSGRARFCLFSDALQQQVERRQSLEQELRHAISEQNQLDVYYQPIVDLTTGVVTAREALARWRHPKYGDVPPSDFIQVAETSGLIGPLGLLILQRACRDVKEWEENVCVAVNVSALQLDHGFANQLMAILGASQLAPHRLQLEITETVLLSQSESKLETLKKIHNFGIKIALDDFGVGYSSLAHVRAFPFDIIKIDGSFVRDAIERSDCGIIVGIIAELGRRLGIVVVAEGVETEEQLVFVKQQGCHQVQGYLIGRPSPLQIW